MVGDTWPIWIWPVLVFLFFTLIFFLPGDAYDHFDAKLYSSVTLKARNRVQIVVLGDIARSPRMRYHAMSIANHGVAVDFVGYVGG